MFFFLFAGLILLTCEYNSSLCKCRFYLWITFCLFCEYARILSTTLHLFVDHNIFILNYETIYELYFIHALSFGSIKFVCSPLVGVGFLRVFLFPPTVQRHAVYVN